MARSIDNPMWQQICVASLVGQCESAVASGRLAPPAEEAMRLLIAETLSAFNMQNHDERNAA